ADGSGRLPEVFERRPERLSGLTSQDGARAVRMDALLLPPGVYILAVSHSGGEGAYTLEVAARDELRPNVIDGEDTVALSIRGRTNTWTPGDQTYTFSLNADQATQHWDLEFQTPLDRPAIARLLDSSGNELLMLESDRGLPQIRRGLQLAASDYSIQVETAGAGARLFRIEPGGASPVDGREVEPNDRQPATLAFGEDLTGALADSDLDRFSVTVGPEQANLGFDLAVTASPESEIELCLLQPQTRLSHCRRGQGGEARLNDLGLAEGEYQITLTDRRRVGPAGALACIITAPVRAGEEMEPNDSATHPVALHERGFGRGRFDGLDRDPDSWRFSVTGEPQLWRLQLQGEGLFELSLSNDSDETIAVQRANGSSRVRLDNQFLMPGDYRVTAEGTNGSYTVRLQSLGPPPPGMELEPNDNLSNAGLMTFGQTYTGTLAEAGDTDRYRFSLLGHERIRLEVQPPEDGSLKGWIGLGDEAQIVSEIRNERAIGGALVWDLHLPAGDYSLSLQPGAISDAEYQISYERLSWLDAPTDREPNDLRDLASPFPSDGQIQGSVGGTHSQRDWYELPLLAQDQMIEVPVISGIRFELFNETAEESIRFERDRERNLDTAMLTSGQRYRLSIGGRGDYVFDLSGLTGSGASQAQQAGAYPPLQLAIELDDESLQAFSPWAQELRGTVTVSGNLPSGQPLVLNHHLSHLGWRLNGLPDALSAGTALPLRLPFSITVPPDAPTSPTPRLSVQLQSGGWTQTTHQVLVVDLDAAALNPSFHWSVPESLRGGFNAAASRFGAQPVTSPGIAANKQEEIALLIDGLARHGRWTEYTLPIGRNGRENYGQPTIQLAGDQPVSIAGFLINPTSGMNPRRFLGEFGVAVSMDGETFETVLSDRLEPAQKEQAFVLDAPVSARYVRLIPITANLADASLENVLRLGEFKVIAEDGWRHQAEPVNLADPALGGHLVWAEPWIRNGTLDTQLLIRDETSPSLDLRSRTRQADIVLGFEHQRAARIGAIAWHGLSDPGTRQRPSSVTVLAAVDGPTGPWQHVDSVAWDATSGRLDLPQPTWARYLRFVFEVEGDTRVIELPDQIEVFEAAGPSVLGEWGYLSSHGPMEAETPPAAPSQQGIPSHNSRAQALSLAGDTPQPGRALLDQYSSWYRLTVPAGQNQLELTLTGLPSMEGAPRLKNANNETIALDLIGATGTSKRWQAWVDPGADYWLEVFEPPRSVIFSWDTSGSVANWLPTIFASLRQYAASVVPGRDEVNLLPFGLNKPLLDTWTGQPYPLTRMMANYSRETSSSEGEAALSVAADQMLDRPGKRAVLMLTDAATNADADLWPALQKAQPQVFGMKLTSEGAFAAHPESEIDRMQNWTRVRGGHFHYVTGYGSLARGFDRAVAWLKRPVDFTVQASFAAVADPGPASLQVIAGEADQDPAARGAVAVILDASGSMLKRMGGQRRIDIAKAAIEQTLATLPDGLPLALRVYGHREAGSCRTDLEIPLGPLDRSSFLARLDDIQAINLARTPIADSIAAIAGDLAQAQGPRLVVLLTDGEETCDGDPAAAIEELQAQGIDVRINIVGFAIDDEQTRAEFSDWAALSGGSYLDAADAERLNEALERALRQPFEVLDMNGTRVALGQVDDEPLELPAGRYRLIISGSSGNQIQEITLAPGEALLIDLGEQ
ncbi:MAG: discoidin domain-containing protein, partial [Pseudomonadota bacterium]